MTVEKECKRGWMILPKYKTDIKTKVIEKLLALRKRNENGDYALSQDFILNGLSIMWGAGIPSTELHHNDRVRLFGILMTVPENREHFQRLAEGPTSRRHLDDPEFSLKQIYQKLVYSSDNELVQIVFPPKSLDLDKIEEINPNDYSLIRIRRDWMWVKHVYESINVNYKAVLKSWFKGTGGGSEITTRLESWDDEKLTRYNINIETYNHTNMANMPPILLDVYCSKGTPYLTVIFLMDKASDYLLASQHDTLKCGRGEPSMDDSVMSVVTTPSKSPRKGNLKTTGSEDIIKSVVDYCKLGGDGDNKKGNEIINDKDIIDEDLPRSDIFELIKQHKLHLD